ncbi:GNAT family N-acetyltransferase [Hyphomicrobium zavarzinii]|jgi:GNAT superfamily N-acetyltransferase|uniref:GNAT family N-acetyltransferase n=1 Tax=Hyphomicrobium zavarzinii TaxID=48292 RepID=UPI0003610F8F|nr:GNAT family N-acetyltransferase [Hyphomicrobium zavarzinii]
MSNVEICRWDGLEPGPARDSRIAELDQVFFSSSATQSFPSDEAKAAFRERWLGRYLRHFPHYALLALDGSKRLVGYVIGSMEDPARDPLFSDLTFLSHFRALTQRYPAHLHVNLDAAWRSRGIGQRLVEAFADEARVAGAPGLHVVTARGMRNVGFYERNGFLERGTASIEGRELLLLGRDLIANP